jgi:mannose-6-phosphate isomerase-like protein (cupin superfamily)
MSYSAVNFEEKLAQFSDHWAPRVIAEMNDYQFEVVKIQGGFVWHDHLHTDETFVVLEGEMAIEFRDGRVDLAAGEMFVVPKGAEHKPVAPRECKVLLIEPQGVVNTGNAKSPLKALNNLWV